MSYLISALVGSVIGYITNFIAIKMLFRPRTEKRLFGFKVPFTPGLIPKEKLRIAKSIGEAVGTHLLTKEQLTKNILNHSMEEKFQKIVEDKIKKFKNSDITLSELIGSIASKDESIHLYIREKLQTSILNFVEKDDTKEKLNDLVQTEVNKYLRKDLKKLKESNTYRFLKEGIYSKVENFKESNESNLLISQIMNNILSPILTNDHKIKDLLPMEMKLQIRNYIENNQENISREVLRFLQEEKTQRDIEGIINKVIGSQVNPMVAMFLKPESLKEKIYIFLNDYLNEKDGQSKVSDTLYSIIEKIMEKTPAQLTYEIDKNISSHAKLKIIDTAKQSIISKNNLEVAMTSIEQKAQTHNSIKELLSDFNENIIENIYVYLTTVINDFLESANLKENLINLSNDIYENTMQTKISSIFADIEDDKLYDISSKITTVIIEFIKKEGSTFIEEIDIARIIEGNINNFDEEFAEKLILDIANKELNAITWLGALLGAIMGLLSPIINSFL